MSDSGSGHSSEDIQRALAERVALQASQRGQTPQERADDIHGELDAAFEEHAAAATERAKSTALNIPEGFVDRQIQGKLSREDVLYLKSSELVNSDSLKYIAREELDVQSDALSLAEVVEKKVFEDRAQALDSPRPKADWQQPGLATADDAVLAGKQNGVVNTIITAVQSWWSTSWANPSNRGRGSDYVQAPTTKVVGGQVVKTDFAKGKSVVLKPSGKYGDNHIGKDHDPMVSDRGKLRYQGHYGGKSMNPQDRLAEFKQQHGRVDGGEEDDAAPTIPSP